MTDDKKTQQLENRIDSLESTIEKMMPSRRDALKMGGAALAGGSLMAGTASAGTNQVGTIGDKDATPPQLVDLHSEDINNADTVTTKDLVATNSASVNGARQFELFEVLTPTGLSSFSVGPTGLGQVRVIFSSLGTDNNQDNLRLQINGTNPNYSFIQNDGTFSSFVSSIRIGEIRRFTNAAMTGQLLITQTGASRSIHIQGPVGADISSIDTGLLAAIVQGGTTNGDLSSDSLDFFIEGSETFGTGSKVFVEYRPL